MTAGAWSESYQVGLAAGIGIGLAVGWLIWCLPWMVRRRQDRDMAEVRRIAGGWSETAQMPVLAHSHRRTPLWRSERLWRPVAFWVSTPFVLIAATAVLVLFMLIAASWVGVTTTGNRLADGFKWLSAPRTPRRVYRRKRTYTLESLRG